jgi:hypothetical protein
VQVHGGLITLTMQENGEVVVDMGRPVFEPARVPFDAHGLVGRHEGADTLWPLDIEGSAYWVSVVSMGNPHAVHVVDDVSAYPVKAVGPTIEHHARFPQRVNAGFMQVRSRHRHPPRLARFARDGSCARRHADHRLGRRARRGRPAIHVGLGHLRVRRRNPHRRLIPADSIRRPPAHFRLSALLALLPIP